MNDKKHLYAPVPHSVPKDKWPERLGNHRVVLKVDLIRKPKSNVIAKIPWRRRDSRPWMKKIFIQDASTGKFIKKIRRILINREKGIISFKPETIPGTYYLYYLPYKPQKNCGFYNKGYIIEKTPYFGALARIFIKTSKMTEAKVVEFQSRTEHDSFYPMEIPATKKEVKMMLKSVNSEYLIFPESRRYPIRMLDNIPFKWLEKGPSLEFTGQAKRNEYYTFQLGILPIQRDLIDVKLKFSGLKDRSGNVILDNSKFTCFNLEGININGEFFRKKLSIKKNTIQPLWIGIDIPETIPSGEYNANIEFSSRNANKESIKIILHVSDDILKDRGDSETWRHSRLRWLNSTLGISNDVIPIFTPLKVEGTSVTFSGKKVVLNDKGLPGSISRGDYYLLNEPIMFSIHGDKSKKDFKDMSLEFSEISKGIVKWRADGSNGFAKISIEGKLEPDGYMRYKITILPSSKPKLHVKDMVLCIPVSSNIGSYFMGMGRKGGKIKNYEWNWNGPSNSFWVGNHHVGLHVKILGASYTGPLLNLYKPKPPSAWYNKGKGKFKVILLEKTNKLQLNTGPMTIHANQGHVLEFAFLVTPLKKLDPRKHFSFKYFHHPSPSKEDYETGINVINIHHATEINPYINYPFIKTRKMKEYIKEKHEMGIKVKIYYTLREMTNFITELWAFRSLGEEIFEQKQRKWWMFFYRKAFPWLKEHLRKNFVAGWYTVLPDDSVDSAIITSGESRLYNYYIEGLAWLLKNIDIDGLYLDDVSFDRRVIKRIRYVMEQIKPGQCMIDLHSNTGFSKGPATKYTEFFPYIDKIWFGESFKYNEMSCDEWFVECSGIPFGLMGDMLQDGGNKWRGMIYGMTTRLPWIPEHSPVPIWKIWDEFGIKDAKMIGYWDESCPVRASNDDIKITVYEKPEKILLSIASWSNSVQKIQLSIDWEKIQLKKDNAMLHAPFIDKFQEEKSFQLEDTILVKPKQGWLLYIQKMDECNGD
ncbi:MAG: glycoside hydrolase domain-containing protein [Promethearchaeota archaeon]